jgi:hypothetical protein
VEREDFDFVMAGPRWRVRGERSTAAITIEILDNPIDACPQLEPFGWMKTLSNMTLEDSPRPKNLQAKYGRRFYRSDQPFCVPEKR